MESSCEFKNLFICYGLRTSGTITIKQGFNRRVRPQGTGGIPGR